MARRPAHTLVPGDPLMSVIRDNRRRSGRPGSPFPALESATDPNAPAANQTNTSQDDASDVGGGPSQ